MAILIVAGFPSRLSRYIFVREPKSARRQRRISVAQRGSRRRSDLRWVGAHAIVLAGHLLDSVVRNSEIRRDRFLFPMPTKIPTN
ncbi:hypothetical protein ACVWXO_003574 [Bradyrhizobium sp. LM2.7]